MTTVEKADSRAAECQLLISRLSAELAEITGAGGNSHFTMDSVDYEK